jgi:ribulose-phosphate 3-epimerase
MSLSSSRLEYAASVISSSPLSFFSSLPLIEGGGVDRLHIDVMDGCFVPRLGIFPEFIREIRDVTSLPIDCHVMTMDPEKHVVELVSAGATRIVPHVEPVHHLHRLVHSILDSGVEAGLAINPHTDVSSLTHVIEYLSVVTVMAINPGIVGHKMIPSSLEKIRRVRNFLESNGFRGDLEVDGGVTFANVESLRDAGASVLVVGAGTLFHPEGKVSDNLSRLEALRAFEGDDR